MWLARLRAAGLTVRTPLTHVRGSVKWACTWLIAAFCFSASAGEIASFSLEDQRSEVHAVGFPSTNVTVIVAADRGGSKGIKPWVEKIASEFDLKSFRMVAVADLSSVPRLVRAPTRLAFRTIDFPILLDWTGSVIPNLNLNPGVPNLILVDGAGKELHRSSATFGEKEFSVFAKELKQALHAKE